MADKGEIASFIGYALGGASAVYGLIKGYLDGRGIVTDWIDRLKNPKGYTVRSTIHQTIIREDQTEFIKLRTLRAHRRLTSLEMDHCPAFAGQNGIRQLATFSSSY